MSDLHRLALAFYFFTKVTPIIIIDLVSVEVTLTYEKG